MTQPFTTVYLAGPIAGCNETEAKDWRQWMRNQLSPMNIQGISPLRCEPLIGARYKTPLEIGYSDPKFGTARAIASKNMTDVKRCDMTLCYMPKHLAFSKGTLVELAWAKAYEKPTVLVTDDEVTAAHPCVQACAGWVLETLDDAVELIVGILGDYSAMNWRA